MNSRAISAGSRCASLYWIVRFTKGVMAMVWIVWGMMSDLPATRYPQPTAHSAHSAAAHITTFISRIRLIRTASPRPPHSPPPAADYRPPASPSKLADRCGPSPPRPPPLRPGRPRPPPRAAPVRTAARRYDRPPKPLRPPPFPDFLRTAPIATGCTHETRAPESAAATAWAAARHATQPRAIVVWPDAFRCAVPPTRASTAHLRHIAPRC